MERAASKGEIDEAELRALEEDMTGRVSLVFVSLTIGRLFRVDNARVVERDTLRSGQRSQRGDFLSLYF